MSVIKQALLALAAALAYTSSDMGNAQESGRIVGWGSQVVGVDLDGGFVAVSAGTYHSIGLKADGSIIAWGDNHYSQSDVPFSNAKFIGVSAGWSHTLALTAEGSVFAWGDALAGETDVPAPNQDFVAVAAGTNHSLGLLTSKWY